MKKPIRRITEVKKEDNNSNFYKTLDQYISDLTKSSAEVDVILETLLRDNSLNIKQKKAVKTSVAEMLKSELSLLKKMGVTGGRRELIEKVLKELGE